MQSHLLAQMAANFLANNANVSRTIKQQISHEQNGGMSTTISITKLQHNYLK